MATKTRLRPYAKSLRNNATEAERQLWRHLRCSQLEGVKFRRQEPIEEFVADFISFEEKLVIELDGSQHLDSIKHDQKRSECLRRNGFTVLRFWDNEIMNNMEGVLEKIRSHFVVGLPHPLAPSRKGRGNP